jgi:hypothetical protein
MGIGLAKSKSSVWVKEEVTEGTYVAPTSANDALEVIEDGLEFNYTKETIERDNLTSTIEKVATRTGLASVAGSIGIENRAHPTEGEAPYADLLFKSLLGGKRQLTAPVTSKAAGHTSTTIEIEDADIGDFVVNGVYLFKISTGYEVRPVTEIDDTIGAAKITVAVAFEAGAPTGAIVIAKMTQYYFNEGAPTLSVTHYLGGEIEERNSGLRCISASLENWSTAQLANWNFSMEGLTQTRSVASPAFTPAFDSSSLPPVLVGACVYFGEPGSMLELQYNELSLTLENTKADILSACSPSGKIGSRFTEFKTTGSFVPYMEDDDVVRFGNFDMNDTVSIFGFAKNPGMVSGQDLQWVAFWIPNAKITEIPAADQDGILTDSISFQSFREAGNDTVFLSFI